MTALAVSHPIDTRLKDLKIIVPDLEAPVGFYVPVIKTGTLLMTSGQLPKTAGKIEYKGKLGKEIDVETGKRAARLALINALAAVKVGLGGKWTGFRRVLSLKAAIASAPGFSDQAAVADGASELLLKIFGPLHGTHARFTWGAIELPQGACIEIELTVEMRSDLRSN
jgi:enamine deaminase RidA (YjgF/YER057c/UK114 family)